MSKIKFYWNIYFSFWYWSRDQWAWAGTFKTQKALALVIWVKSVAALSCTGAFVRAGYTKKRIKMTTISVPPIIWTVTISDYLYWNFLLRYNWNVLLAESSQIANTAAVPVTVFNLFINRGANQLGAFKISINTATDTLHLIYVTPFLFIQWLVLVPSVLDSDPTLTAIN